jgi:hypothetical protein
MRSSSTGCEFVGRTGQTISMGKTPDPAESVTVTIRPARLTDAAAFASLATQLGYLSSPPQVEERLTAVLHDPKHLILAADSEGRVVGWSHAYVCCLVESDMTWNSVAWWWMNPIAAGESEQSCSKKWRGGRAKRVPVQFPCARISSAMKLTSSTRRGDTSRSKPNMPFASHSNPCGPTCRQADDKVRVVPR